MSFAGGAGAGAGAGAGVSTAGQLDPVFVAQMRLRKRKFDDCIAICTRLLEENPLDQVLAWWCVSVFASSPRLMTERALSSITGGVASEVPSPDSKDVD